MPPRKKKIPPYSLSFAVNGKEDVYTGDSILSCLEQLTDKSEMVFKTKLILTIKKGEKTAVQLMSRPFFRRMCSDKITKRLWANKFELLVQ